MGAAFFITSFYAYVPIMFPNNIEKYIGICELIAGIGFLIGPVAGSIIYNLGGYLAPFLSFGGLTVFITPFIYFYIQSSNKVEISDLVTDDLP